ncbi:hypothetical protein DAEQUDRAFT_731917 [Daedalea quercina L-15889]|uniref:Transmembrane protein n=1 Tax=Daedalea quercina L-15889 TaxID=1314783 RepID=A0A165LZN5_9APHY|nr:hypothetical protein DAEQUDRAFT_731917 [Daedalea quercina L-15889]
MSANSALAQAIETAEIEVAFECCLMAACAIYTYDRWLTFWWEVDLIWHRKSGMSVATCLYMLLHVSTAVCLYLDFIFLFLEGCEVNYVTYVALESAAALFRFANGAFTALRAYAISGHSVLLASAVFVSSLVVVATQIYGICSAYTEATATGCIVHSYQFKNLEFGRLLLGFGQASTIIPEALLVAAAWWYAYTPARASSSAHTSLTVTFIRDGSVYFIAILVLQIAVTTLASIPKTADSFLSPVALALQTSLLTHFYLNLHEASAARRNVSDLNTSRMSDFISSRVIGNLAGSLLHVADHSTTNDTHGEDDLRLGDEYEQRCIDVETAVTATDTSSSASSPGCP